MRREDAENCFTTEDTEDAEGSRCRSLLCVLRVLRGENQQFSA